MKCSRQNSETKTGNVRAIPRVALLSAVLTAVLMLGSCVWGMTSVEQSGRISISVGGSGEIGAMDLSVFERVTFFVATADSFRRVDPVISFRENPSLQRESDVSNFSAFQTAAAVTFSPSELGSAAGQLVAIPNGQAVTFDGAALPSVVSFENLDVDRDYVVWIDATNNVEIGSPRLGYALARVRAGADTRVTVTIPVGDGFQQFLDFVYARFVVPITPFVVGDIGPAGGIIFYVDEAGDFPWTYLEAAPAGWFDEFAPTYEFAQGVVYVDGEDPLLIWESVPAGSGLSLADVVEAQVADVGAGPSNTAAIVTAIARDVEFSAHVAAELELNGFDDWFLPSQDELNLLYEHLMDRDVPLGGLLSARYWSSTQHTQSIARLQNFADGASELGSKPSTHRVRPIRRF